MSQPEPGSVEWLAYMTASKIGAVVGTSPYESRFSLWHRMAGNLGPQELTNPMNVGNVLEPALIAWFKSQHPDIEVAPSKWCVHPRVKWAAATPDAFAGLDALVEAKTARNAWEWANGVPAGYQDQCQWEMWVTGTQRVYVVALVAMDLVEHVIEYDAGRVAELTQEAAVFMDSLRHNEPPPLDGSTYTYQAIRELHPEIDPDDVDIHDDLALRWLDARWSVEHWTEQEQQAKSEIAALMGNAKRARWNSTTLFTRQARNGGTPYLVTGRNLPEIGSAA